MRTVLVSDKERSEAPRAGVRRNDVPGGPSDAPLAIVYVAIICCAVTAMLVLAVAAVS